MPRSTRGPWGQRGPRAYLPLARPWACDETWDKAFLHEWDPSSVLAGTRRYERARSLTGPPNEPSAPVTNLATVTHSGWKAFCVAP